MSYFAIDYSTEGDLDHPDYKVCQFCKDIGRVWYDEDFIGVIPRLDEEVDLEEVLTEAAVDESEKGNIKDICSHYDISKANAIFWYADADLVIPISSQKKYNGLTYIGLFDGD